MFNIDNESIIKNSEVSKPKTRKKRIRKKVYKNILNNKTTRQGNYIYGYSVSYKPGFEEYLKKVAPDNEFFKIGDGIGILLSDIDDQELMISIISSPFALSITPVTPIEMLGKISQGTIGGVNANEEIGVNFFKNNPNIPLSGKGVLIGIEDSGIDYLHPDFIYEDGTSKILYLWDQTKEGSPPKGFTLGTEYNREQLNEAIAKKDASLSIDEEGTGTMNAGICAGRGTVNPDYSGVAEDAELIVVKLMKINGFYTNSALYAATKYIYDKAQELDMPIVLSLGGGSTSLAGVFTRTTNDLDYYSQGVCAVVAAGNEGDTQTHSQGVFKNNGEEHYVDFQIDQPEKNIQIQVWIQRPDIVTADIITPSGEDTKILEVSGYSSVSGLFDFERTRYKILTVYPSTDGGQQVINIHLSNVASGIWRIRLTSLNITHGSYYVYLQNRSFLNPGTRFLNPSQDHTITYPAVLEDNITVGAYNTITNSLWSGSSRGPTISNLLKPDIVAPGVNIISTYPGGGYATITGTAPSASYVAGCTALLMQYILVDRRYPDKAFVQNIRTIFRASADRDPLLIYPNTNSGYGFINMRNAFNIIR